MQIFVRTPTYTITLDVEPNNTIQYVKAELQHKWGLIDQVLRFRGKRLQNDGMTLSDYNIKEQTTIHSCTKIKGGGMKIFCYDEIKEAVVYGQKRFVLPSYHVSCQSDKITGENMAGVVLYSYDDKQDWRLNNVHCKSGYIILKLSKNIEQYKCSGQVHGACYKSVFGKDIDKKVVGGGFAFFNGKWKFRSYSLNIATIYHNSEKGMHKMEEQCVMAAIENWKKGIQNTKCKDIRA
eukprot:556330_1